MEMIIAYDHVDSRMQLDTAYFRPRKVSLVIYMMDMVVFDKRKNASQIAYYACLPTVMYIAVTDDM